MVLDGEINHLRARIAALEDENARLKERLEIGREQRVEAEERRIAAEARVARLTEALKEAREILEAVAILDDGDLAKIDAALGEDGDD